jgi:predicted O-linked N-acetylglucosamine transferase (SPINDLY family)
MDKSITHIGFGNFERDKSKTNMNENLWKVFYPPLGLNVTKNNKQAINIIKNKFPKGKIFGTIAREEKFNSEEFIDTLIEILNKCPESIYIYTGRKNSEILLKKLKKFNLLNRSFYIGWVDSNLYSELIDIFLDTFPAGCGITAVQSLFHGTILISKWGDTTLPKFYFNDLLSAKKFNSNWKCASNKEEYINYAIESYNNKSYSKNQKIDIIKGFKILDSDKFQNFLNIINS